MMKILRNLSQLLSGIALGVLVSSCSPCESELVSDNASPDGKLIATVLIRECGAMARSGTWVTIHSRSMASDREDSIVFTASGEHKVEVSWLDNSHALVQCRTCKKTDVRRQAEKLGMVNISFRLD